jgi:DNA-binding response OmpR family regulator
MKKIIAVDDEKDLLFTIKMVIEYFNDEYKVTTLKSGKKLFKLLEKEIPDLILLDIMMPDINGWDIHKKLKSTKKWSKIPIIFISSVADDTSKITANSIGDDFIGKPFEINDLKSRIDKILKSKNTTDSR